GAGKDDPQAKEEAARQLGEAARRQAEVAEKLGQVDPANQDARRDRAQAALNRALADLMDARREDVGTSQAAARRELERLEQALAGQKPADEQARDLARRQHELAREATRAAADPKSNARALQELQRRQRQVAREVRELPAPEAPKQRAEAAEATRKAADQA